LLYHIYLILIRTDFSDWLFHFFSLISISGIIGFDLGGHEFEGLDASLVVGFEKVDLGELGAKVVGLSDRFENF
jgi:hypothetical protein